jgi:hypothetical protein
LRSLTGTAAAIHMALADTNADGLLDLHTLHDFFYPLQANRMLLRTFGSATGPAPDPTVGVDLTTANMEPADVSADGRLDLLAAGIGGPGAVKILLGTPGGGLGATIHLNLGMGTHSWVHVADWNSDGIPDLAVSAGPTGVTFARGLGAVTWTFATTVPTSSFPTNTQSADFNGDGLPDWAALFAATGHIGVSLNRGQGFHFTPVVETPVSPGGAYDLVLGDFDNDGLLDAVTSDGSTGIWIVHGTGGGGFGPASRIPCPGSLRAIARADLDDDGYLDVIAPNYTLGQIDVFRGSAAGLLAPKSYASPPHPNFAVLADFDGDGALDVAVGNYDVPQLSIFRGNGAGSLLPPKTYELAHRPKLACAVDSSADGRMDLWVLLEDGVTSFDVVRILRNGALAGAGLASYGSGTPGFHGQLGLAGLGAPKVGNGAFALQATNARPESLGLVILGDAALPAGGDPFGIGATLLVDLFASTQLYFFHALTDAAGASRMPLPIPANPHIAGSKFYAQAVFIEDLASGFAVTPSPFGIVTSTGLTITIQP